MNRHTDRAGPSGSRPGQRKKHLPNRTKHGELATQWSIQWHWLTVATICLLTFFSYSNTLSCPFLFDDFTNIQGNRHIRMSELTWPNILDAARNSPDSKRPLANISFALNHYFGEYQVMGYHVVNLAFHIVNVLLVYWIVAFTIRIDDSRRAKNLSPQQKCASCWIAPLAAILFAVHPIQIQAVTYIVQRMTNMCTMFCLLAMLLYILGRTTTNKRKWFYFALATVHWIAALATKEIAATLPLLILMYEWFFFQDLKRRWLLRHLPWMLALGVLLAAISLMFLGTTPLEKIQDGYEPRDFSMGERILTQFRVLILYITLLFYPAPDRLNLLHLIPTSNSPVHPPVTLLSITLVVAIVGMAIALCKQQRILSFGIIWWLGCLAIESTIIPLEMIYEHRLYLPMLGFCWVVAYPLAHLATPRLTHSATLFLLLAVVLSGLTYWRNHQWNQQIYFWNDVVHKSPQSARAHNNLGKALAREGLQTEAIRAYEQALDLDSDLSLAYNNRANSYSDLGNFAAAIDDLTTAINQDPENGIFFFNRGFSHQRAGMLNLALKDYEQASRLHPNDAHIINSQGGVLLEMNQYDEALERFNRAINMLPHYADAYSNRGNTFRELKDYHSSINDYATAIQLEPDNAMYYSNRGSCLGDMGRRKEALHDFSQAIRCDESYVQTYLNRADLQQRYNNYKAAIMDFNHVIALNAGTADVWNNRGGCHAQLKHFEAAIRDFDQAIQLHPGYATAYRNRGFVHEKLGHTKQARQDYIRAAELEQK